MGLHGLSLQVEPQISNHFYGPVDFFFHFPLLEIILYYFQLCTSSPILGCVFVSTEVCLSSCCLAPTEVDTEIHSKVSSSIHVGFVVDKVALGQVFSEYISVSPANLHSTNFSTITITYHPGLVQ
jgi:hypothetical protein